MKTTPTIRIEVALAPAVVLEQLARYGKDWHESRLPPEARKYAWCAIDVQGSSFELRLGRTARGVAVSWRGSVDAEQGGEGGSIVTAVGRLPTLSFTVIPPLLGVALSAGYQFAKGARVAELLPVLGAVLVFVFLILVWARRSQWKLADRQASPCRAVLLRATERATKSSE
ncbi:MAG TPA: hypothetical protein VJO33_19400 [Gemmatimonadaceae bacterium]|nr:hypothetical protein [Gemmatimonadaceae bacterium]